MNEAVRKVHLRRSTRRACTMSPLSIVCFHYFIRLTIPFIRFSLLQETKNKFAKRKNKNPIDPQEQVPQAEVAARVRRDSRRCQEGAPVSQVTSIDITMSRVQESAKAQRAVYGVYFSTA